MPKPMTAILSIALLLRLFIAWRFQNIIAPDEIYQALEQAHRLVYGHGIVPWEFQVGLRNWLIPLTLALPMEAARLLGATPYGGLLLIRALQCAASLGIVWAAAKWGERYHGERGLWITGLLAAFWPDLWLMAPHPLEEVFAADVLVPAVFLVTTGRRVALAAFLLGLAFTLRIQLAPAIALAGITLCGRDPKRWFLALPIAAIPVLAAGLLDWLSWGQPFRSFWLNIYLNVGLGLAAKQFGASPVGYFLLILGISWLWTLPVFAVLANRGAKSLRLPGVMALIIILTHTAISHKEFRFIFPAVALLIPLVGIGLTEIWGERKLTVPGIALTALLLAGPIANPWAWFLLNLNSSSYKAFEALAAQHIHLVTIQPLNKSFLPLDIVFPSSMQLTASAGRNVDAIVAQVPGPTVPEWFQRLSCYKPNWVPMVKVANPPFCIFINQSPAPDVMTVSPLTYMFPAAATPFRVRDRLTDAPDTMKSTP